MKNSCYFSTVLLSLVCLNVNSQTISEEDATLRAISFLHQSKQARGRDADCSDVMLAHTAAYNDEAYFYVFNYGSDPDQGGFVIVGADERTEEILGYSENGQFDYDSAPENFKWWMSQYVEGIHAAIKQGVNPRQSSPRNQASARTRATIDNLIKTHWSQSAPYYNEIPTVSGYDNFVTGCVATAMAQVMYYHRCPAEYGSGSHSYSRTYNYRSVTFSADFGSTRYDWENMKLDYQDNNWSNAEADAVAKLMYHAGVSVDMRYNTSGNGGSGAMSDDIPNALSTYFGYDKSVEFVERKYYKDEQWFDLIYSELEAGRPVIYGGSNAYGSGGHQFICHGYNADTQLYAINWGWNGAYDGFFTLMGVDGLQPSGNGVGGSGSGASYTSGQDAIINVMPDAGGSAPLKVYHYDTYTPTFTDADGNQTFTASYNVSTDTRNMTYNVRPANYDNYAKDVELCVMLKNSETGEFHYSNDIYSNTFQSLRSYKVPININNTDFAIDGTYEVYAMIREQGTQQWKKLRMSSSFETPIINVVGNSNQGMQDVSFDISGTEVVVYSSLYISHDQFYTGAIEYSSSDPSILSVNSLGEVSALAPGTATITAKALGNNYYNQTTAEWQVTAKPYTKVPLEFSISDTKFSVGKTSTISCISPNYTGTITYTSDKITVATVNNNGEISGVSVGTATIKVTATSDKLYAATEQTFQITVTGDCFILESYEIPNGGYITQDAIYITTTITNNTGKSQYYPLDVTFTNETTGYSRFITADYYYSKGSTLTKKYSLPSSWRANFPVGSVGNITITEEDGTVVVDKAPFTICESFSIDYAIGSDGWNTLCLPFEATIPDGMKVYSVTNGEDGILKLTQDSKIQMNTPYLVQGTEGTYTFQGLDTPTGSLWQNGVLVGNTQKESEGTIYAPAGSYVLQNKKGVLGFFRVRRNNIEEIPSYNAYLQLSETASDSYSCLVIDDEECAIQAIEVDDDDAEDELNYNLQGQRVQSGQKGLIIKQGKVSFRK